ncbi:hypothetical protein [Staphylococcus hominis]|uniref:hypothetical protein n=1 Tax=Staphylococcus hominis TaxID=1290 RepID=UPI0011A5F6E4|nr:hypothetical protein [Staphylococcus hominis]
MQDSGYVNMDVQVPALAFEYKDKPGVYISEYMDKTTDLNNALLWANKDLSKPDKKECKEFYLKCEKMHAEKMKQMFGENAIITFKPSEWFEICNLVDVHISVKRVMEMMKEEQ